YRPLSADVAALTRAHGAGALSDRFEIASELAYFGLDARIVGRTPQVRQALRWHPRDRVPSRALAGSFSPLNKGGGLRRTLTEAYASLRPGPVLRYEHADGTLAVFHTMWCERPTARATHALYGTEASAAHV